jgi:hypothetical protein
VRRIGRSSVIAAWVLAAACGDAAAPDSKAPSVSLTLTPCCLVTIPGAQVTVAANATDNVGVEHVEFLVRSPSQQISVQFADDSTAPFTAIYPPAGFVTGDDGAYALSVQAYDAAGNVGTAQVTFAVAMDVAPPSVTLTASPGRITSSVALPVTIDASEPLSRVEVYDGSTLVASAIEPVLPKRLFVPLTAAANGTRALTARAWDRAGNVADSHPDTIVVDIRWVWDATPVLTGSSYQAVTAAGGSVYAAGRTSSGFADALLVKLDSSGAVVWTRTFGIAGIWDDGQSVTRDVDGNIYLGVWRYAGAQNTRDCILVKYDPDGQQLWSRDIPGDQEESCSVATDSIGAMYVAGGREPFDSIANTFSPEAFVAKYDRDGNLTWQRSVAPLYSGSAFEFGGIAVDRTGALYLTGGAVDTLQPGSARSQFLLKLDDAGNEVWKRFITYGYAAGIAVDSAGSVYVTGAIADAPPFIAKYDSAGTQLWYETFGTTPAAHPQELTVNPQGVYLTGYADSLPGLLVGQATDIFLAAFDGNGVLTDLRTYDGQGNEEGFGISTDGTGAAYLAGWLRGYQTGVVIKYHP